MDLKNLLGKLDLIEGSMKQAAKEPTGPKYTGQWQGTDAGTPGKKLVGDSIESKESILKDLSKGPKPKTQEQELAEQFEQFLQALEEENLGINDKRPARKGSRPQRKYTKDDQPSTRYTYNSEETDESRGHKIVANKLKDVERSKEPSTDNLKQRKEQAKADYAKYVAKMQKINPDYVPLYKMDEAGANNPPQQNTPTQPAATPQQQQQAKNVAQGTQALKAAVGANAPTDVLAKAIDSASQGTAIDATSAKALEPMMDVIKQAAQDPNLANQFKSLASQAKTSAVKQQSQQQKQSNQSS
jgi:hypothetical protein